MMVPRVSSVLMVFLVASMTPVAFADENSQEAQKAISGDAAAKPIEVDVWAVAIGSVDDSEDDADNAGPISRAITPPELKDRDEVTAWIEDLAEQKRLVASRHFVLATIAGHTASAKIGADVPAVTSASITEFGLTNSVIMSPVGTLLKVTPYDSGGAIRLKFTFETSELRKSDDVVLVKPKVGPGLAAQQTDHRSFESSVEVGDGDVVVAHCSDVDTKRLEESYVILVSARRIEQE